MARSSPFYGLHPFQASVAAIDPYEALSNGSLTYRTQQLWLAASNAQKSETFFSTNLFFTLNSKRSYNPYPNPSPSAAAYEERDKPIQLVQLTNSNSNRGFIFDIFDSVRASNRYTDDQGRGPEFATGGINLTTDNGDDLLYPNGRGQYDLWGAPSSLKTIVDYGYTWVNSGNGNDVVVGGYGIDRIGSRASRPMQVTSLDFSTKESITNIERNPYRIPPSTSTGSKFYVGGSGDDVLDGGQDDDFLVGDRFNNTELYIKSSATNINIPATFARHKQLIDSYQPLSWSAGITPSNNLQSARGESRLGDHWYNFDFNYPLWVPGNDVMFGGRGNDFIYGDNNINTISDLVDIKQLARETNNFNPPESDQNILGGNRPYTNAPKMNWNSIILGADFIDGGDGSDEIFAGFGSDAIIGGPGSDMINCGDQIIAPGYKPFYGPKIVWGDTYPLNGNRADPEYQNIKKYPDVFVIGDLYTTEAQILAGAGSPSSNQGPSLKTAADKIRDYEATWNSVNNVIDFIPVAGPIISAVGDVIFNLLNLNTTPDIIGTKPYVADSLTVIKDFDPFDTFIIRTPNGGAVETNLIDREGKKGPASTKDFAVAGIEQINPLASNTIYANGRIVQTINDASNQYDRVLLENYLGEVYPIKKVEHKVNGIVDSIDWIYGGSDFKPFDLGDPGRTQTL